MPRNAQASIIGHTNVVPKQYLPTYLPIYLHTYIHTYLPTYLFTYLPTYLLTYLPTYLPDETELWSFDVIRLHGITCHHGHTEIINDQNSYILHPNFT